MPQCVLASFFVGVFVFAANAQEVREIPLESVYTTSYQKGLRKADASFKVKKGNVKVYNTTYGPTLSNILRNDKSGAKNIFLTRGDDLDSAIEATHDVLLQSRGVDAPAFREENEKSKKIWLSVYLGRNNPDRLLIDSIERNDKTFRLCFSTKKPGGFEVQESLRHYYWVELGVLKKGTYSVEIYDSDSKQVILQRRIPVQ